MCAKDLSISVDSFELSFCRIYGLVYKPISRLLVKFLLKSLLLIVDGANLGVKECEGNRVGTGKLNVLFIRRCSTLCLFYFYCSQLHFCTSLIKSFKIKHL